MSDNAASDKAVNQFRLRFPALYSRFIAVIRGLQYSIRTEKTYLFWVARFVLHGRFTTADEMQPDKIAPYLEHLAVNRNVAPNTQSVALNALIFFYKHILKLEVEGKLDYKRAAKPRRLPVVLSVDEINRLLSGINNTLYRLMASLLYGSGLRLMECIRFQGIEYRSKQCLLITSLSPTRAHGRIKYRTTGKANDADQTTEGKARTGLFVIWLRSAALDPVLSTSPIGSALVRLPV